MRARVRPGERQVIRSVTQPGRSVSFQVTYANGDTQRAQTIADAQGIATYSYAQRSSTITRRNTKATVRVTAGSAAAAGSYTVAYGPIDISVEPRRQHPGGAVIVWVHSLARTAVSVAVSSSRRRDHVFSGVTDAVGWIHTTYRLPSALSTGVVQFVARRPGARTSETVRIQSNSRKLWIQSPAAGRVAGSGRALLWLAGTQNELVGTSVPVAPSYAYTERARKRGTP
jgi:hypothetical protein